MPSSAGVVLRASACVYGCYMAISIPPFLFLFLPLPATKHLGKSHMELPVCCASVQRDEVLS